MWQNGGLMTQSQSSKKINVHLLLGDSAWLKTGEVYKKAESALMKLSLSDLQTIRTVIKTTPEDVNKVLGTNNQDVSNHALGLNDDQTVRV
jgi:hypothetical protein